LFLHDGGGQAEALGVAAGKGPVEFGAIELRQVPVCLGVLPAARACVRSLQAHEIASVVSLLPPAFHSPLA
jgi:hypothetical protein